MKRCFKCQQVKNLEEFYRHPAMGDGRLGKCKECAKADVKSNRSDKREYYSRYDQERYKRPERRQASQRYLTLYRQRNPEKYIAHNAVNNALRDGRLIKQPCTYCGSTVRVEGHHSDYSKPLDVTWVCFKCHREEEHGQVVIAA